MHGPKGTEFLKYGLMQRAERTYMTKLKLNTFKWIVSIVWYCFRHVKAFIFLFLLFRLNCHCPSKMMK